MANTVEIIVTAETAKALKNLGSVTSSLGLVGKAVAVLGTAMAGLSVVAVKSFSDFESAFAGVRKTIDGTEADFAILAQGIRNMAQEIPASVEEISRVAEAAGQLGIAKENVLGFTRTMIDLGNTTNLSGEQAATQLARLANITKLPQNEFDKLGSTIVDLGNNLATTEGEIVDMALRLAGAGAQIGLTQDQILAFSGALSSVGINAEAGGTAFSRVMVDIANSVATGGNKLKEFADISGQSVSDFKKSFETDASGALISFIEGLGRTAESGDNVFETLENLGFANVRVRDALLRASGAGDLFRKSLDIGSKAWEDNTALTKEASQRYETLASKFKITLNIINDVAITIGKALAPAIHDMLDLVQRFAKGFGKVIINLPAIMQISMDAIRDIFGQSLQDMFILWTEWQTIIMTPFQKAFQLVASNIKFAWQIVIQEMSILTIDTIIGMAEKFNSIPLVPNIDISGLTTLKKVITDNIIEPPKEAVDVIKEGINQIKDTLKRIGDNPALEKFRDKFKEIMEETEQLTSTFSNKSSENIKKGLGITEPQVDQMKDAWESIITSYQESMITIQEVGAETWSSFEQGAGDAVGRAVVFGEDLGKAFESLMKNLVANLISSLVQMGIQQLILGQLTKNANSQLASSTLGKNAASTFGSTFASVMSSLPYPANVAVAPGMAAGMQAAVIAGSLGAGAAGSAAGATIGQSDDGIQTVPRRGTFLLDQGERVVSAQENQDLKQFLKNQGVGKGMTIQTLNIMPNSSIDEALMNKPASWWLKAFKNGILPAMNSLGSTGTTTTMQPRGGRV